MGIAQQWAAPDTVAWWRYFAALVVGGLFFEWYSSRTTGLRIDARPAYQLRLGRPEHVTIDIANSGMRMRSVVFASGLPLEIECSADERAADVAPSAQVSADLLVTGRDIGHFSWPRLPAKVKGPLGLAWWPIKLTMETELTVVPDLLSARQHTAGDALLGDQFAKPGAGLELDHLREYVRGDPLHTIDWKATARSQKLITRVFSEEQRLEIFLVVDAGRTSRTHVDGMSQLGHYINLAAQFAQFAMASGDNVGLVAVADRPLVVLPPQRGSRGAIAMNRALRNLQSSPVETDILSAALQVQQLARERCLVILITDLYGQAVEGNFGRSLRLWQTRHLPFVVSLIGKDVIALGDGSDEKVDPFTSLAAAEYQHVVRANAEAARRLGAQAIVARPAELHARVISEYQRLKRQRRV